MQRPLHITLNVRLLECQSVRMLECPFLGPLSTNALFGAHILYLFLICR